MLLLEWFSPLLVAGVNYDAVSIVCEKLCSGKVTRLLKQGSWVRSFAINSKILIKSKYVYDKSF